MNRKQEYMDRLLVHYNYAQEHCQYPIFGVFLVGSQNYSLDDEQSDVDAYAMYIHPPKKPKRHISLEYSPEKGQTTPYPFYSWLKGMKTQQISKVLLESLSTDYVFINPLFQEEWEQLLKIKEYLFKYYASNFHFAMLTEYETILNRIKSRPYYKENFSIPVRCNKKEAIHCKRLQLILEQGDPSLTPAQLLKMNFLSPEERNDLILQRRGRKEIQIQELLTRPFTPNDSFNLQAPSMQKDSFLDTEIQQIWDSVLSKIEKSKKELTK